MKIKAIRKYLILAVVMSIIFAISSAFLFGCEKEKKYVFTAASHGSVLKTIENGDTFYQAIPDEWYSFDGWYENNLFYSDKPTIKITSKTPTKLEARFICTALNSFDRMLNNLYNTYKAGDSEGQYLQMKMQGEYSQNNILKSYDFGGFISPINESSQFSLNFGDFSFIYNLNSEISTILVGFGEEKTGYANMGSLTNVITNIPDVKDVWSVKSIFGEQVYFRLNQLFGIDTSSGFVESVENGEHYSYVTLSVNKILNMIKNIYPRLEEGSAIKFIADIFVGNYLDSQLPKMTLTLKASYSEEETEKFNSLSMKLNLSKDYNLNINGKVVTIPQSEIDINLNNFELGKVKSPDMIDEEIISSYPISSHNMINARVLGGLSFNTDEGTLDNYKLELNMDINPFALLSYKREGEGLDRIEWSKLGFFSLKITLIEDEENLDEQMARHNAAKNYLNILIDSARFGAVMFVYSELYNPACLQLTKSYFVNEAFDIPEILTSQGKDRNRLALWALSLIAKFGGEFDVNNLGESLNNILLALSKDNELIASNLEVKDNLLVLSLTELRAEWRKIEEENNIKFLGSPIRLDTYVFGEDEITSLALSFESIAPCSVNKSLEGFYLDSVGNEIKTNSPYLTIAKIKSIDLESIDKDNLEGLVGKQVKADVIFIDGSEGNTFVSNKAKIEEIKLDILKVRVLSQQDNQIKIRLSLQVHDSNPSISYDGQKNFGQILKDNLNIHYGLYTLDLII